MKLNKKRRLQNKTNYRKRLILLEGSLPRLVVRKTNRYIIMQIIESENAQDKATSSANTKDLLKYGWPENKKGSLKSITACYLGGFLIGKKSKAKKLILDMGLIPNTKGSRVYAVVKGALDAGIEINCNEKIFPSEERIKGEGKVDIKQIIDKISANKSLEVKKLKEKNKEAKK
jgi:large subunit ribosomal protein L18